jgi:hypothetical protein
MLGKENNYYIHNNPYMTFSPHMVMIRVWKNNMRKFKILKFPLLFPAELFEKRLSLLSFWNILFFPTENFSKTHFYTFWWLDKSFKMLLPKSKHICTNGLIVYRV